MESSTNHVILARFPATAVCKKLSLGFPQIIVAGALARQCAGIVCRPGTITTMQYRMILMRVLEESTHAMLDCNTGLDAHSSVREMH